MTGVPFVRFEGISKSWNGTVGVEDVTLDIPQGAFAAFLGPSGCGKSTTLRLLAGLETPDSGRIAIRGEDVTGRPASARNLSMVFQSYALFPHLNVAENILFGLKVRRVPKRERLEKLRRAVEITGLNGLENRRPGAISGGQRQRVALARAIVAGHPLCLMDEPLSNLDAKLRHSVRKDIKRLQRDLGLTVIYVTHDQTEAMSMADIIVLMREGRIEQMGTPQMLYDRPANLFVAGFVGSPPMATVEGSAVAGGDADSIVGIRPEDVLLAAPGRGDLQASVSECEYLGSETHVALSHPQATGLSLKLPKSETLEPGAAVDLLFPPEKRHLFDRDSTRRRATDTPNPAAARSTVAARSLRSVNPQDLSPILPDRNLS